MGDQSYRVSVLYQESTTRLYYADALEQPELERLFEDMLGDPNDRDEQNHLLRRMVQVFAPPVSATSLIHRMHPDVAFGLAVLAQLVILVPVAAFQPGYLPAALGLLVSAAILYLLGRDSMLRLYGLRMRREQEAVHHMELARQRWEQLYFCSRDRCIFFPGEERIISLDQLPVYLNDFKTFPSIQPT